jgi:FMN phosphatase YigB (HAD superfamily)
MSRSAEAPVPQDPVPQIFDWSGVRLVAFDVDGTLYRQPPLRARMAAALAWHALTRRDLKTPRVLSAYRRLREQMGEAGVEDFEPRLLDATAAKTGASPQAVAAVVAHWIDRKPLRHLAACAYPGLPVLFAAIRASGRKVGVLSDYPARAKLAALGLDADYVVAAGDPGVGVLKPHPRGLQVLMAQAGAGAHETVLVGDRASRDGEAARAAGARALILSKRPQAGWTTFAAYDDPVFADLKP